jgi:hypothetical protein
MGKCTLEGLRAQSSRSTQRLALTPNRYVSRRMPKDKAMLVLMDRTDRNAVKTLKRGLKKTRKMSEATKAKLRAAAKARWAKIKKG